MNFTTYGNEINNESDGWVSRFSCLCYVKLVLITSTFVIVLNLNSSLKLQTSSHSQTNYIPSKSFNENIVIIKLLLAFNLMLQIWVRNCTAGERLSTTNALTSLWNISSVNVSLLLVSLTSL